MKVTAIAVTSVNGYLTNGDDPDVTSWTSEEDQQHFRDTKNNAKLIIMGKNTYLAMKDVMRPEPQKLRVVLTNNPNDFDDVRVEGQLEFSNSNIIDLLDQLQERGYNELLLIGGGKVYGEFMANDLIDELILTIEPVVFSSGRQLFDNSFFSDTRFELSSIRQLNESGTLLLNYQRKD